MGIPKNKDTPQKIIQLIKDGVTSQKEIGEKLDLTDVGYWIRAMKRKGVLKNTMQHHPLELLSVDALPAPVGNRIDQKLIDVLNDGPKILNRIVESAGLPKTSAYKGLQRLIKRALVRRMADKSYALIDVPMRNGNGMNGAHDPRPNLATNRDIREIQELLMRALDRVRQLEAKVINDKQKQMLSSFARSFADS